MSIMVASDTLHPIVHITKYKRRMIQLDTKYFKLGFSIHMPGTIYKWFLGRSGQIFSSIELAVKLWSDRDFVLFSYESIYGSSCPFPFPFPFPSSSLFRYISLIRQYHDHQRNINRGLFWKKFTKPILFLNLAPFRGKYTWGAVSTD